VPVSTGKSTLVSTKKLFPSHDFPLRHGGRNGVGSNLNLKETFKTVDTVLVID
jgi:hypothetical protein